MNPNMNDLVRIIFNKYGRGQGKSTTVTIIKPSAKTVPMVWSCISASVLESSEKHPTFKEEL